MFTIIQLEPLKINAVMVWPIELSINYCQFRYRLLYRQSRIRLVLNADIFDWWKCSLWLVDQNTTNQWVNPVPVHVCAALLLAVLLIRLNCNWAINIEIQIVLQTLLKNVSGDEVHTTTINCWVRIFLVCNFAMEFVDLYKLEFEGINAVILSL